MYAVVACVRVSRYVLATVLFERSEKSLLHDLFHSRSFLSVDLQAKRKSERQWGRRIARGNYFSSNVTCTCRVENEEGRGGEDSKDECTLSQCMTMCVCASVCKCVRVHACVCAGVHVYACSSCLYKSATVCISYCPVCMRGLKNDFSMTCSTLGHSSVFLQFIYN